MFLASFVLTEHATVSIVTVYAVGGVHVGVQCQGRQGADDDFEAVRAHLLNDQRLFGVWGTGESTTPTVIPELVGS
jgi:hypothetical protein